MSVIARGVILFLSPSGRGWIGHRPRRVRGILSALAEWREPPSSGAARHLLPDGEKKKRASCLPHHPLPASPIKGEVPRHSDGPIQFHPPAFTSPQGEAKKENSNDR